MAERAPVPVELEHAQRHVTAALAEWDAGKMELAAMYLREAIADAAWCLYYSFAGRDPWPTTELDVDAGQLAGAQLRAGAKAAAASLHVAGSDALLRAVRGEAELGPDVELVDVDPE